MWHLLEIVQEKINTLKRKVIVKNLPILPSHRFYNIILLNKKSISIYQLTNAHIISHKTHLKHFKTLRHVSILSDHHQGALFLAKVILQHSQFNSYLQIEL